MPATRLPSHIRLISENTIEVTRLMNIHEAVGGKKPGRKFGLEVLNKSGVVLLVACWEAFVGELARQSFRFLLKNSKNPGSFSNKVLALAGRSLRAAEDETRIWELAGDGWKRVLNSHGERILRQNLAYVNVPDSKKVDEVFEKLLGIRRLSSSWSWAGMPAYRSRRKLDALVTLRHEIAHRVSTRRPVYKVTVIKHADFVHRLAEVTSNHLREILLSKTKKSPWIPVTYGSTKNG